MPSRGRGRSTGHTRGSRVKRQCPEPESEKSEAASPTLLFRWQWEDSEGVWRWHSSAQDMEITEAFRKGNALVNILSESGNMKLQIDFKKMVQRNSKTRTERRIAVAIKEQSSYFIWQWQSDEEDDWIPYDAKTCLALEAALAESNESKIDVMFGRKHYTLDLGNMVQTNCKSGYQRRIERRPSVAVELTEANGGSTRNKSSALSMECPSEAKKARGEFVVQGVKQALAAEDAEKNDTNRENKVKTLLLKGKAPVDPECKVKVGKAHVYCEGGDVYDVMLNQTNLQFNNNKYYIIQLLEDDGQKNFSVWMRWGRVGKVGQHNLVTCSGDLNKAKEIFQKKFFDKTKNSWEDRGSFEKVPGKYDMLQMDYTTNTQGEEESKEGTFAPISPPKVECQLELPVQELMELICNIQTMEEMMVEMKYDIKKAPLGKLTVAQIKAGYQSLKKIEDCIRSGRSGRILVEACNEFYTRIPHDFGLHTPPLIRTEQELKDKIQLLEVRDVCVDGCPTSFSFISPGIHLSLLSILYLQALGDIEIAIKLVKTELKTPEHPLDQHYRNLHCALHPLDYSCHEFKVISEYLHSTHAPTHNDYTMTLLDVFEVEKEGENEAFKKDLPNRMLLWHGSRLGNWVGILSHGLRIAPPEAPITGYMFGKGIYFADMSSKSANYCFASRLKDVGLLLLSEVALGEYNELLEANPEAAGLLQGKHSTKGMGKMAPNPSHYVTLNGTTVPLGPASNTGVLNPQGYTLNYNEFIVYDPSQVRMRYLLKIRFNFPQLW
ncbi:poly [ADP-ribose] polymerase 2 isoform X2 [Vombatus ursinus]|uniref:poly [ADP-ribose] polymerase 2 isoform X2 n=1 Tax=Vombatus ursinus TaxID=29139 RepID=UPI000FFD6B52|nr:poly [ADP-ribose] polymerase 2 isoform X2 [Vombatus ursinus]